MIRFMFDNSIFLIPYILLVVELVFLIVVIKNGKKIFQNITKDKILVGIIVVGILLRVIIAPFLKSSFQGESQTLEYFFEQKNLDLINSSKTFRESPIIATNYSVLGLLFANSIILNFFVFIHSILVLVLIFLLGKELFNKEIGYLAAFFLALNPNQIFFSTNIYFIIIPFFYLLLQIYFLFRYMKENKQYLFTLSLLLAFLNVFSRRENAIFAVLIFVVFIFFSKNLRTLKRMKILAFGLFVIILLLISLIHAKNYESFLPLKSKLSYFLVNISNLNFIQPFNNLILIIPVLFLVLRKNIKWNKNHFILLILIFVFTPLLMITWDFSPRHFLVSSSLLTLLIANIIEKGFSSKDKIDNIISIFFIVCFLILSTIHLIELNKRYFISDEKFSNELIVPINYHSQFKVINNCIIKNSIIIFKSESLFPNISSSNYILYINDLLATSKISDLDFSKNIYLVYDSQFYKMAGDNVFFRTNKVLNYLDLEQEPKHNCNGNDFILYKVKGKRNIFTILYRSFILPVNYITPKFISTDYQ